MNNFETIQKIETFTLYSNRIRPFIMESLELNEQNRLELAIIDTLFEHFDAVFNKRAQSLIKTFPYTHSDGTIEYYEDAQSDDVMRLFALKFKFIGKTVKQSDRGLFCEIDYNSLSKLEKQYNKSFYEAIAYLRSKIKQRIDLENAVSSSDDLNPKAMIFLEEKNIIAFETKKEKTLPMPKKKNLINTSDLVWLREIYVEMVHVFEEMIRSIQNHSSYTFPLHKSSTSNLK